MTTLQAMDALRDAIRAEVIGEMVAKLTAVIEESEDDELYLDGIADAIITIQG